MSSIYWTGRQSWEQFTQAFGGDQERGIRPGTAVAARPRPQMGSLRPSLLGPGWAARVGGTAQAAGCSIVRCLTPARPGAGLACRRPVGAAGRNEEYEGRSTERSARASPAGVSADRAAPGG